MTGMQVQKMLILKTILDKLCAKSMSIEDAYIDIMKMYDQPPDVLELACKIHDIAIVEVEPTRQTAVQVMESSRLPVPSKSKSSVDPCYRGYSNTEEK